MGCGVVTRRAEELGVIDGSPREQLDISQNFSGAGVFAKVVQIPAGVRILKHRHNYDHLSILISGVVNLETDDGTQTMMAPESVVIKANTYHRVTAVTDATWICLHPTQDGIK
jgi:quercetin dioxygenase-like cupin family protein